MADNNEFLLQTLQNINASLSALNVRLDHIDDEQGEHKARIAVIEDRVDKNSAVAITSLIGGVFLVLIKAFDWVSGR